MIPGQTHCPACGDPLPRPESRERWYQAPEGQPDLHYWGECAQRWAEMPEEAKVEAMKVACGEGR